VSGFPSAKASRSNKSSFLSAIIVLNNCLSLHTTVNKISASRISKVRMESFGDGMVRALGRASYSVEYMFAKSNGVGGAATVVINKNWCSGYPYTSLVHLVNLVPRVLEKINSSQIFMTNQQWAYLQNNVPKLYPTTEQAGAIRDGDDGEAAPPAGGAAVGGGGGGDGAPVADGA
jgi:hypothetical protein